MMSNINFTTPKPRFNDVDSMMFSDELVLICEPVPLRYEDTYTFKIELNERSEIT